MASWNHPRDDDENDNIELLLDFIFPTLTALWVMLLCSGCLVIISLLFKLSGW